jgi:hypothetical protein
MNSTSTPNIFDIYFEYVKQTEPPLIFHRWALLGCLSAVLGRQTWLPFGSFKIYPNQYIMLLGEPGTRKSTAIKLAAKVITKAGYERFAGDKTRKEKFLEDLEGLNESDGIDGHVSGGSVMESLMGTSSGEAKEVFICADEFNDFMPCGDLEFHSLLGKLWDWDEEDRPYKYRLKNSRSVNIFQPTVNLLGGNTHANFSEMFPPQALGQGFISRMILVFSEPSGRKIARPQPPSAEMEMHLVRAIQTMRAKITGPMEVSSKAEQILDYLYNSYEGLNDIRFSSYTTRRYTHLLKLCILCAAVRYSTRIDMEDLLLANTILTYTEHFMPRALGEFGKAKNSDTQQRLLDLLLRSKTPIDSGDLWKQVSSDLERMEDLHRLLAGLTAAGKITYIKGTGGNSLQGYLATRKALTSSQLYVNFDLLTEYQHAKI